MTTKGMVRTTIELYEGDKSHLQEMAFCLGYIQTRGKEKGKVGSVSALMQAIVKGEVEVRKV